MPPADDHRTTNLQRLLSQSLANWHDAGVRQLPRKTAVEVEAVSQESTAPIERPKSEVREYQPPRRDTPPPEPPSHEVRQPIASSPAPTQPFQSMLDNPLPPPVADPAAALRVLREEVSGCKLCRELASTRTQTVFGVGNPKARLLFFGEAPGADEDARGEPFVGRAGQLLTKIIEACTLTRDDVYILNTLKCRPPGNRNPSTEEAANCRPYFEKQLELIQPEYICCLGSVAAQNLLETTTPIGKLRGKFHNYRGMKVIATYHPAYLLRNPPAKRYVWDDMQMLMKAMGIKLPNAT